MYTTQTPFFSSFSSLTGALEETSSAPKDLPPVPQPEASSSRLRTQPNTQTPFVSSFSALSGALGQASFAPRDLHTVPQPVASSSRLETPVHTPAYYLAGAEAGASNDTTPVSSSGPRTPGFDDHTHLCDYDFHSSPSPIPAAAAAASPNPCGVPVITGDAYLDSLLFRRYFPTSTYEHSAHWLAEISYFHEIPNPRQNPHPTREDLRIPNWLRNILGQGILDLFRATGGIRKDLGSVKFAQTYVPYLYLRSAQGNELLHMSWELLARIELSGHDGQFNRWDTTYATTPNGAMVSVLSREHLREIALSDPQSITDRTAFLPPNPPFVTGGILPYHMTVSVPDSKAEVDMKAWFEMVVDYLDDERTRVTNMREAIQETAIEVAAQAAAKAAAAAIPGPSRVAQSGKGKRKRDSDSENVEKPKNAKKRKGL